MVEKKFKALRFVAGLFKVFAWIALIGGILAAIGVLLAGIIGGGLGSMMGGETGSQLGGILSGTLIGIVGFIVLIIAALINFVVLKAMSELWELFIALEHNTRMTALYVSGGQASPVITPPAM